MAPQLSHTDIQELLGAYAIDAVDDDEAAIIDAHLTVCPRCRNEVAAHREAASLLSYTGAVAPDGVWSGIAAGLEETPPARAHPVPLAPRRRGPTRALAAVAAVAAAMIGLLSMQVARQGERLDHLAAISDRHGLDEAAAAAAVSPGARTARLTSDDGRQIVDAVVLPDGHGYLVRARLAGVGQNQTYQLWGVIGAQTISLGVLGPDPGVTPFHAAGPLTALAITAEHAGGAVAPTTTPIVQGFLTAA